MTSEVSVLTPPAQSNSVTVFMADKFGMEAAPFEATLRATVFPSNGTREQFAAFLLVAKIHDLNPLTKEIYAFPAKGGGIVPIVSIDGWLKLINTHPQFDGLECEAENDEAGDLFAMRCSIYRRDRSRPTVITEYLSECIRSTEPWKMKHRMLRHKAAIQCARYAFGFAGIYDDEEGERVAKADPPFRVGITPVSHALGAGPMRQIAATTIIENTESLPRADIAPQPSAAPGEGTEVVAAASVGEEGDVQLSSISTDTPMSDSKEGLDSPSDPVTGEVEQEPSAGATGAQEPPQPTDDASYQRWVFWWGTGVVTTHGEASARWKAERTIRNKLQVSSEAVEACKAFLGKTWPDPGATSGRA